jgi:hypothetical protein
MFHFNCWVQSTHVNQNHPIRAISPSPKNTMSPLFLATIWRLRKWISMQSLGVECYCYQHPTLLILPVGGSSFSFSPPPRVINRWCCLHCRWAFHTKNGLQASLVAFKGRLQFWHIGPLCHGLLSHDKEFAFYGVWFHAIIVLEILLARSLVI